MRSSDGIPRCKVCGTGLIDDMASLCEGCEDAISSFGGGA